MIQTTSKTITLAAYQVLPMAITAGVFSCAAATAPFNIAFDDGEFIPMQAGWTMDARPSTFERIILQNTSAQAVTITFYAGNSQLLYSPVQTAAVISNAGTYTRGTGIVQTTPNTFNGLDSTTFAGLTKLRKQIVITNLDATNAITVQDGSGKQMAQIAAGQVWTVESNATFVVINPYGVNYCVGEIFYA